jgi:hypothetical protein
MTYVECIVRRLWTVDRHQIVKILIKKDYFYLNLAKYAVGGLTKGSKCAIIIGIVKIEL